MNIKKPTAQSELNRVYRMMAETDITSEEYTLLLDRANKLESAANKHRENTGIKANLIGNGTTILTSVFAYWHEDILGRIATRGLARNFIPKSSTR